MYRVARANYSADVGAEAKSRVLCDSEERLSVRGREVDVERWSRKRYLRDFLGPDQAIPVTAIILFQRSVFFRFKSLVVSKKRLVVRCFCVASVAR